ncbi:MAG: hypothetical protein RQ753_00440 [Desulfurivibrionaceae bacterium]|nr:hypothetical protein [Desulfobulbales bacterium]MDT8334143.1 hypothetical protein [Desulfurivibrionaceae bacterium]
MSKKIVTLLMAVAFTVGMAGVGMAAKDVKCKVKAVDGKTLTLECQEGADTFKAGSKVTVKAAKRRAIEGC